MGRQRAREAGSVAADGRRLYSTGDVARICGLTRSRVQYLVKQHVVLPDWPAKGGGNHLGFTFRNLLEFAVSAQLSDAPTHLLANITATLRGQAPEDSRESTETFKKLRDEAIANDTRPEPTKDEAFEWQAKYGFGEGHYADPEWLLNAERFNKFFFPEDDDSYFKALDQLGVTDETLDAEEAFWRRFTDPAQRLATDRPFLAYDHLFSDSGRLLEYLGRVPTAPVVNLRMVIEWLERKTGDQWRPVLG